jgi:hypothetical protein
MGVSYVTFISFSLAAFISHIFTELGEVIPPVITVFWMLIYPQEIITISSLYRQDQHNCLLLAFIINTATRFGRTGRPSSGKTQFPGKSVKADAFPSPTTIKLCYN